MNEREVPISKIALLGAGGKMGVRLSTNLQGSDYDVAHVEISDAGRQRLKEAIGADCVDQTSALASADIVVMAVPDKQIGTIARTFVSDLNPGTAVIVLDAAAPHAGELPERDDITYFVTHPCHPPLFNDETLVEAKNDFFGGQHAKQHIICALMQGPEEHYAQCEDVARTIYKPVMRAHRVSVEHMAILEPALSETVGATLALATRRAVDHAVGMGVPKQAAMDFMLGHLNIELSIAYEAFDGRFSDGALEAIADAESVIFKDGWIERVFDPDAVMESVKKICKP